MALGRMTLRQNESARERMRDEETMDDWGTKIEREKREVKERNRERQRGKTGRREKREKEGKKINSDKEWDKKDKDKEW